MNTNKKISNESSINIVADIGGTNLRIGISEQSSKVSQLEVYRCGNYQSLSDILEHYIQEKGLLGKVINMCLAIACPVDNDLISMTNLPWKFKKSELKESLKLNSLVMINDYTAIAHAVPMLDDHQKVKIGGGDTVPFQPISICGPGTGLGVANIVFHNKENISIDGEGGHVDFAPTDAIEIAVLSFLLTKYEHVSYEQLLSGLGIEQIYQALCHINNHQEQGFSAEQISEKAINNSCELCQQTMTLFCKILGSFAGNLALTLGSFGGVYIAGGIAPRFIEFIKQSDFRKGFEAKGRFTACNQRIATFVITESQPGIIGASAFLHQHLMNE